MNQNESGWIRGLRIFAWINLAAGIIGGATAAWQVGVMFGVPATTRWDSFRQASVHVPAQPHWGFFIITLIITFMATFIVTAVIMIFLNMARDIAITAVNSTNATSEMARINNMFVASNVTTSTIQCKRCNAAFDDNHKYCPCCSFEKCAEIDILD